MTELLSTLIKCYDYTFEIVRGFKEIKKEIAHKDSVINLLTTKNINDKTIRHSIIVLL